MSYMSEEGSVLFSFSEPQRLVSDGKFWNAEEWMVGLR